MKLIAVALLGIALAQGQPVQYFKTGNTILKNVVQWEKYARGDRPGDLSSISYFQGYVAGVLDAEGRQIRTPDALTHDQACAIVAKFLRDNPQSLNQPAADLVKAALRAAYPAGGVLVPQR
ncbi:MAG: Rap1a/Tai family immunity protein [Acidobacteria bacterium]|nr:Rap1a/Tai family immunity protein [Acidobacteriota bacterium]